MPEARKLQKVDGVTFCGELVDRSDERAQTGIIPRRVTSAGRTSKGPGVGDGVKENAFFAPLALWGRGNVLNYESDERFFKHYFWGHHTVPHAMHTERADPLEQTAHPKRCAQVRYRTFPKTLFFFFSLKECWT